MSMTKLDIISALWSVIFNLKLGIRLEETNREIEKLREECQKYAEADDEELFWEESQ